MLNPRAIATLGIGYEPAVIARLGLWSPGAVPINLDEITGYSVVDSEFFFGIDYSPLSCQAVLTVEGYEVVTDEYIVEISGLLTYAVLDTELGVVAESGELIAEPDGWCEYTVDIPVLKAVY